MLSFDISQVPSPCYAIEIDRLRANAELFGRIRKDSGAKVFLALKGYAAFSTFDILRPHLDGTCASGPLEARLGAEEFGGDTHVYAVAFSDEGLEEALTHATALSFNSLAQWRRYRETVEERRPDLLCGLRVNPEQSASPSAKYDPCNPGSRLGVRASELGGADLTGISGISFHALCEADSRDLERVLGAVEERFGALLQQLSWVNFGGGHMATRPGYDVDHLTQLIREFRERHDVEVHLEPGEAIAYDAGYLVATVLDIVAADTPTAVLDTSATAHAPDVLEMPYQPEVVGASTDANKHPHAYTLGGQSCLACDVFGTYSFPTPLSIGDRLAFTDMAHYSMVKNNTFNGLPLPAIVLVEAGDIRLQREFGYSDFRSRLS